VRGHEKTTCVTIVNTRIFNVNVGAALNGDRILFANNAINNFGDDGIDFGGNDITITHNMITNNNTIGDGVHLDAMQGYTDRKRPGGAASEQFNNILIDGNIVLRQTDPNLKFPTYLQGIDAFDEDWRNVVVSNNVVVTSACWGIGFASVHGGRIINNTVISDDLITLPCRPGVGVGDKTHEGSSSNDVVIRNNLASGLNIYYLGSNMVMDHNICVAIEGKCVIGGILTSEGGRPKWSAFKPGEYRDRNVIDGRGPAGEFVNFDPPKLVYDLRLRSGARAIGAGSPDSAPTVDIVGAARTIPFDAGAYAYQR
jgi:hypothetical protein